MTTPAPTDPPPSTPSTPDAPDILLPSGRWRLWPQFALRGTGFPASGVLRMAPADLVQAADQLKPGPGGVQGPDWKRFERRFADTAVDTARELQAVAGSPLFRTAIAWQNRALLGRAVDPFTAWSPSAAGRTSSHRQREELIAHYWQRFCVKNDTIGFFGPVGWGEWDPHQTGLTIDPGHGLIADSAVFFSSWAIDTVAAILDADPVLHDWVAPRRVPFVRLTDAGVRVPGRPTQPITAAQRAVLRRCDGTVPARVIRGELPDADPALAELVKRRWVVWRLEVPAGTHPDRVLRAWLHRVDDHTARQRGLDLLDTLAHGRDRIQAATGPAELTDALAALEAEFVARTDTAAAREKGAATAPCRTLVYSDSRRSAGVRLGADVLAAVGAPLDLLLTSAAWLTSALADRVLTRTRAVYERLRAAGPVDLASCWFAAMPILHGDAAGDITELRDEFWRRWASILDAPDNAEDVRVSSARIGEAVRAAFHAPGRAWTTARYLSPDILLTATDADAVARGDYELVLGELHVAMNTLGNSLFVNQHPDRSRLDAQTDRDLPEPRLFPMLPKEHRARLSARIRHSLDRPRDYYVALADHTVDPHRPRTVRSADVTVTDRDGTLVAVLPDGAEFDLADVFSHVLTTLVVDRFQLLPEAAHTPRVTIDRMVVARQTWRFAAAELGFAADKSEARRFVLARRWWAERGLPRFVFVVSPTEPRPFYVDIDSPLYVNLFLKAVRRLARTEPEGRLVITEMLPTPEQAWLTDDQGERYTAELRFVAVDQKA